MATIQITEYTHLAPDASGKRTQIPAEPALVDTQLAFTAATTHQFNANTRYVRLQPDAAACRIRFGHQGDSVEATATNQKLNADTEYFRSVRRNMEISVYDGTT